jgi:pilus assembly protein CpaB
MRPKSRILLSLALGCGLVAALGINQMMAKQGPAVPGGETVEIYVAMKDVNTNDQLLPELLKLEPWPKDKVPPDAITKLDDLEGRRARTKLFAGEPVREAKLLEKGDAGIGAADTVPTGFRVVSVRVDAVKSSGNLIKPGDRVDVIVHISNHSGRSGNEPMTKTFLQDVRVFAVNDVLDRDPASGNSKVAAQTISLLVKPDQVELVTLAEEMGKVRLSMRSPNDDVKTETDGAVMTELLGDHTSEAQRSEESGGHETAQANPLLNLLDKLKVAPPAAVTEVAVNDSSPFRMTIIRGPDLEEIEIDEHGRLSSNAKGKKQSQPAVQTQPSAAAADLPFVPVEPQPNKEASSLKLQ